MTPARARRLVVALALVAHATALGNGFAIDDETIVATNPVVTESRWSEALLGPYWTTAREGAGLYRPITVSAFVGQHALWSLRPLGYHAVSLALHALASLLLLAVLLRVAPPLAAALGAALFAIHPVHVEAVANVVGTSELLAACAVLAACVLFLDRPAWTAGRRPLNTASILLLYLVGLGAKEIAVVLPALLVVLALLGPAGDDRSPARRLRGALPLVGALTGVLVGYLLLRASVLGTVTGEVAAPWLRGSSTGVRVLTALAAWPHYLRLLVFPFDLVSDYAPGVTTVHPRLDAAAATGAAVLLATGALAWRARRGAALVASGAAWFLVAVLPVSNLLVATGMLLAERVLYLPSVGLSLAAAGAAAAWEARGRPAPRAALAATLLVALLLIVRSATRAPTWASTPRVLATLVREHPESYVAVRARAAALAASGDTAAALAAYDDALALAPALYALTVEAAGLRARARDDARAETLLREAVALRPDQPVAYRLLAELYLRTGRGRDAHAVALDGLARAGPDRELWSLVSEAYIAKGDLEASVRARRAALGVDPESVTDWARLAELHDALGDTVEAERARARAGGR